MKIKNSTRIGKMTFICLSFLLIIFYFFPSNIFAQDQSNQILGAPQGSYKLNFFEDIDLFSGHLNISFPIHQLHGRGESSRSISLRMETQWTVLRENCDPEDQLCPGPTDEPVPHIYMGVSDYVRVETVRTGTSATGSCGQPVTSLTMLVAKVQDGTSYQLVDTVTGGKFLTYPRCSQIAGYRGTTFVSTDGSGATYVSDCPVYEIGSRICGSTLYLADGTQYRFSSPQVPGQIVRTIKDKNGNLSSVTGYNPDTQYPNGRTVVQDSNGRTVEIVDQFFDVGIGSVKTKGVGGDERIYQIVHGMLSGNLRTTQPNDSPTLRTLGQLFPQTTGFMANETNDFGVVSSLVLPNGQSYRFKYDVYGSVARVELPTGGAYEYDYGPMHGLHVWGSQTHRLVERREYDENNNLTLITRFATPDVTDYLPDGITVIGKTSHYFYGTPFTEPNPYRWWQDGKEYRTQYWNENGTAVVKTVDKTWFQYMRPGCTQNWNAGYDFEGCAPNNPRVSEVTTTLNDTNQVSKLVYSYDDDVPYNNVKEVYEYDWGIGVPGSLLRQTSTTYNKDPLYISPSGSHLRRLPLTKIVKSGTGQIFSRTVYQYDGYVLLPRNNVFGHDSTNYGTSYLRRGNVTAITNYTDAQNESGPITTYLYYDILGNVVQKIDARGKVTTINYDDKFGLPDGEATSNTPPAQLNGQNTFAFPTSVTNPLGWTAQTQYDYFTGSVVNTENVNGVISKTLYNDLLGRPTQTFTAVSTANKMQSTTVYDDVNRRVLVTSDLNTLSDNLIKSESFYDFEGRPTENRSYKDGDYVIAKSQYNALGRVEQTTNPYRPLRNEQAVWIKTKYDGLGRATELESPDGSKILKNYLGNATTVTDQAGKKRTGYFDALERAVRVAEDPNGQNLITDYIFDAVGNIRKIQQGGQTRYFMYDSLGRLLYAKQPEQNTNTSLSATDFLTGNTQWSISYQYDANSNIISTTDARGISIVGTYDDLNRLTVRNYSDSTPDVAFTFDDPAIPYSKGRMTKVSSAVSETR